MTKNIDLQRIGGEAELIVYDDGGVVRQAYFITIAPVRGFEKIVKGKNPVFAVNAVMRICGICHAAHGIASAEAIEDAMGVSPPANGRYIREVIGLLNKIQSHLMHLVMIIPDFLDENERLNHIVTALNILNKINNILTKIGGAPTHPPYLVIGGVNKVPDDKTLSKLLEETDKLIDEYVSLKKRFLENISNSELIDLLKSKKYRPKKYLASHLFYGDKYSIRIDKIKVIRYEDLHENAPEEARENTSMIALYDNQIVEAGPRARLYKYYDYHNDSLWGIQEARLIEIELFLKRVKELFEKIEIGEPGYSKVLVYRSGKGVGVFEAPRGTLIHMVELDDDGRIENYRIIVPTMFNIPLIEDASKGFPTKYVDVIPRIYDPCIPCSTHIVKLKERCEG